MQYTVNVNTQKPNGRRPRVNRGQLWADAEVVEAVRRMAARRVLEGDRATSRTIVNLAVAEYAKRHHPDLAMGLKVAIKLR